MKAAVITPLVLGFQGYYGGGERYAVEFARALNRLVPCDYLTFGESHQARRDMYGLRHVTVPAVFLRGDATDPIAPGLLRCLRGYDVIHCHGLNKMVLLAALYGKASRTPVHLTSHGGGSRTGIVRLRLYHLFSGFPVVSHYTLRQYPWMASKPTAVLWGGGDASGFPTALPSAGRRKQVLYIGRVTPHKGIDVLVRALPDDAELIVCGSVVSEDYFRVIRDLAVGKNIRFVHDVDDNALGVLYLQSRVVVLPSVERDYLGNEHPHPELLGLVLLESMWHGTPVVASAVGGIPEIVYDGDNGLLVPPGDVAALRDSLELLLGGGSYWTAMSCRAKAITAERFTWAATAERALAFYG